MKIRWHIAYFLDRSKRRCWADAVSWALKSDGATLIQHGAGVRCAAESETHRDGCCYCGKFRAGLMRQLPDVGSGVGRG